MNNRLLLLNHRANRLKRPERIREAIDKVTGKLIKVISLDSRYAYEDICSNRIYYEDDLTILDNPEEGD